MMDLFLLVSDVAAKVVRSGVCLLLTARLLSKKKPGMRGIAAVWAGVALLSAACFVTGGPAFCFTALKTVWIAACMNRILDIDARMSLFISIYYEIAVSFGQFLLAAWLGVLFHSAAFLDPASGYGQIGIWLFFAMLVAFAFCVCARSEAAVRGRHRMASVLVAAGLLAVVTLSEQTVLTIPEDILDTWTILAVVLMMSVQIFHMNRQYETEKELAKVQAEQARLLERDYTALNQAYAVHAKLFHDFHNHLGVLRQLLTHAKAEEAMQYLDELQAPVQEMTDTIWTGDETIDYLINSKAAAAKSGGISYQVEVEFPRHTNLQSVDLCAILGNLLDNGLEAAEQVPDLEARFLKLTIRRIHQMLVIKVENSFRALSIGADGTFRTTKEEKGLHGWGLRSVRAAAEKYDGIVQTSYADHVFTAVVTLSFEGISRN